MPVQISNDRSHVLFGMHELLRGACVKHLDNQPPDHFEFEVRSGTSTKAIVLSATRADSPFQSFHGFDVFEVLSGVGV